MQFQKDEAPDNMALQSIEFASKSITSTETQFSNTEGEALGILYGLETFHHCCFTHEVKCYNRPTLLMAIFKTDIVSLPHRLQGFILHIHQYNI